jgi:hypothetical protein
MLVNHHEDDKEEWKKSSWSLSSEHKLFRGCNFSSSCLVLLLSNIGFMLIIHFLSLISLQHSLNVSQFLLSHDVRGISSINKVLMSFILDFVQFNCIIYFCRRWINWKVQKLVKVRLLSFKELKNIIGDHREK